jgi:hypothetical protein
MVRRLACLGLCAAGCVALVLGNEYELGRWGRRPLVQAELEAALRERFDLASLTLREEAPGHFVGTGSGATGRSYEFDVTQGSTERHIVADWRIAKPSAEARADLTTVYINRWLVPAVVGLTFVGIAAATLTPVVFPDRGDRPVAS